MKFKEFLDNLNKYAKSNPKSLELDVIPSSDDEGNSYNYVNYSPSKGVFQDGEFIEEGELEDWGVSKTNINTVCVN